MVSILAIGYLLFLSLYLLWHGMWFSPDQFFIAALLGVLILGKSKQFIRDWTPPLALFLGYESLRALIPHLTSQVNIFPMINFDHFFFGTIPSVTLQNLLFTGTNIHWYDYVSVLVYESHFVMFLIVGFIFWLKRREVFHNYFLAILLLSYMSFVTFIVFPAMPPWMASQKGFIPPLSDIANTVSAHFPKAMSLPTIYQFFGANLVAAVPSIHAAYPWLIFLFILKQTRLFGFLFIPYVASVWFAIVYLGDHYVFDIVAGVIYATIAFLIVTKLKGVRKDEKHITN